MARLTDVVGYAYEGALYCPEHKPKMVDKDKVSPVFLHEVKPEDHCDSCLAEWIHGKNNGPTPSWVYLEGAEG